ncbi:hypothetical protein CRG98_012605 [Punica granatum]|uniref:Uncharacterized protein n=1 Tax=Punica granatum TaxID=22663 RepID=A0A2I0KER0_PUNGR|nr:hypothetical protein CRG98_012605 [Punica granatum]
MHVRGARCTGSAAGVHGRRAGRRAGVQACARGEQACAGVRAGARGLRGRAGWRAAGTQLALFTQK